MGYIIFISVFNVTRNWQEAGFRFQQVVIIIINLKMYLKGVPFFNGRCTQISTFPVKNGIQNREGLDRGKQPPQCKTFIGM